MTFKPLEELFGCSEEDLSPVDKKMKIIELDPAEVSDFKGHPFAVTMDEAMAELVDSIRRNGVLHPGIARPTPEGGYEAIAGHRRKYACQLAGQERMPFIVRDYTDDEATMIMVESNIQRPNISVREKALAYRMHYEAAKRMRKEKGTDGIADEALRSDEQLAKRLGESRNTIQRYIRLTYLIPELLELADTGKLPVITASDLSYLREDEQELLLRYMQQHKTVPNGRQAIRLKEQSRTHKLTLLRIKEILTGKNSEKATQKVILKGKILSQYFPEATKPDQIEKVIIMLLQKWQREQQKQREADQQLPGQMEIGDWEDGRYMPE